MPNSETELEVEVFRTGDYGPKGVYTREDLDHVASSYNPELHEAPVTLDHARRGPAHGWVAGLKVMGDRLVARLRQVNPALLQSIRTGAFRKRSIELFRSFQETGRPYLKAVSFLGAAPPAVNGLADPAFKHDEPETIVFTTSDPEPADRDAIRARLIDAGTWNPKWEDAGLFDIFDDLPGEPSRDALAELLAIEPVSISRGSHERHDDESTSSFSAGLRGVDEPASAEAHLRALRLMGSHPELDYRTALLQSS